MGKRSSFERMPRDFYPTPYEAILPLLPHIPHARFIEPCAGDGALVRHLEKHGHTCVDAFDIEPQAEDIRTDDALTFRREDGYSHFITNPPWDREILHPLIFNLCHQKPTWLLFDADWMHTKQAIPFMEMCCKIVSVGRVKWIPDSKMTGKDNCCWYKFDYWSAPKHPAMIARQAA
ncbi:MAG TPA: hypothetical protein VN039_00840 [Nitrospira sp.]|nr:hypothetical protein [Nitrospira sp.]